MRPTIQNPKSKIQNYLSSDSDADTLIRASARNHVSWFTACALAQGGEVRRGNGATWILSPKETVIAFPRMVSSVAGEQMDRILADSRSYGVKSASCWAVTPTRPRDLGARLAARGFEWGWQPHWMAMDARKLKDEALPNGVEIRVDEGDAWDVKDLPYYSPEDAALYRALCLQSPRRSWHFGAWLDGKPVGHVVLHLSTGALGVGGIYSLGVVPEARRKGIAGTVMRAACRHADALGCRYTLLNSAADEFYTAIGWESLGWGQTWWMHPPAMAAPHPSPERIAFAEAIGRGDVKSLNALDDEGNLPDMNAPLLNGSPPMDLAVRSSQPAAVEWLAAHGAELELLHAWDLGWKDRAESMLHERPELANRSFGRWNMTPLHEAVSRNDVELARLLLTANPDLSREDSEYHGTPLGWAKHLNCPEIATLIEAHLSV